MKDKNKKSCDSCDKEHDHEHPHNKKNRDWLLWGSILIIFFSYIYHLLSPYFLSQSLFAPTFASSIFELMNKMWWGVILGIFFVGLLDKIPQNLILRILGKGESLTGLFRATLAGVFLDLCSHGILLVGMQLYKKGVSTGQIMAFLIASPWNSLSLTLILWSLVGFKWMIAFLLLSMLIAVVSGYIFILLEKKRIIAPNPYTISVNKNVSVKKELNAFKKNIDLSPQGFSLIFVNGLKGSRMVLRWIFFGVVLAALVRTFLSPESFQTLFGPTLVGLGLTIIVATILEVCSEGSLPLATDILTRAGAPGNAFAFLMTGVSTDYTEIMAIKETTKSWKTALFLPIVTLPQVILLALILNGII